MNAETMLFLTAFRLELETQPLRSLDVGMIQDWMEEQSLGRPLLDPDDPHPPMFRFTEYWNRTRTFADTREWYGHVFSLWAEMGELSASCKWWKVHCYCTPTACHVFQLLNHLEQDISDALLS